MCGYFKTNSYNKVGQFKPLINKSKSNQYKCHNNNPNKTKTNLNKTGTISAVSDNSQIKHPSSNKMIMILGLFKISGILITLAIPIRIVNSNSLAVSEISQTLAPLKIIITITISMILVNKITLTTNHFNNPNNKINKKKWPRSTY